MNRIIMTVAILLVGIAGNAQRWYSSHVYVRPCVVVSPGYYAPYYYSPGFYGFGAYPVYHTAYRRPSKLEQQIADIKNDYKDRIWSVRHDKTMSRKDRKQEVHTLKHERDAAIRDAEMNYHRKPAANVQLSSPPAATQDSGSNL